LSFFEFFRRSDREFFAGFNKLLRELPSVVMDHYRTGYLPPILRLIALTPALEP
jgi:hypothetical protein